MKISLMIFISYVMISVKKMCSISVVLMLIRIIFLCWFVGSLVVSVLMMIVLLFVSMRLIISIDLNVVSVVGLFKLEKLVMM